MLCKIKILAIGVLLTGSVYAQGSGDSLAAVHKSDSLVRVYYNGFGLNYDSAASPLLYREVKSWIGTRYKYAGHTKQGIDCSGFVAAMYRSAYGKTLSGGSRDLYPQVDTVARKELREGDILFFKIRRGQVSHVGIYLGNDKFAHASVHSGVIISDLKEDYYRKYYFTGGRLKK